MLESGQIVRKSAIERVDEGLRQYMIKVFNYMGVGLAITTLAAYVTLYTSADACPERHLRSPSWRHRHPG